MQGYIKLYRQIVENEIYFEERFTKAQAWIDLLLLAGFKERTITIRNVNISLKPGQLAYSQLNLSERWKWNRRTVKKFLIELEKTGMIHNRFSRVTTIISIINWEKYQGDAQQTADSAQQKSAEMHNRDAQQESGENNSNGHIMGSNGVNDAQQKLPKNDKGVHTNNNVIKQAAAADTNFYQFINKFCDAARNNQIFVNENAAILKLKDYYSEYGEEQMRGCFNTAIHRAVTKKKAGEKIRDIVQYGIEILGMDYKPLDREQSKVVYYE